MKASRAVLICVLVAGLLAGTASAAVNIETVTVGEPGNAADMRYNLGQRPEGYGRVDYDYRIGKYEVTAGRYAEFLNKVAATDTYSLYNPYMDASQSQFGCNIKRTGSPGSYTYSVAADWANRPVNWVSWFDAARFCNWLTNGQPMGPQGLSTTEDGAYFLNGSNTVVSRKANARYVIPTEDEWYKAAYYDPAKSGGAGYWDYPTRSNTCPSKVFDPNGTNNATYYNGSSYTVGQPYYMTEVGAIVNSSGPYGTFDQGGNVSEWTESVGAYYDYCPIQRGGSWNSPGLQMYASWMSIYSGGGEDNRLGFRVAYVPEPTSLALVAFGGIGAFVRRRSSGR